MISGKAKYVHKANNPFVNVAKNVLYRRFRQRKNTVLRKIDFEPRLKSHYKQGRKNCARKYMHIWTIVSLHYLDRKRVESIWS